MKLNKTKNNKRTVINLALDESDDEVELVEPVMKIPKYEFQTKYAYSWTLQQLQQFYHSIHHYANQTDNGTLDVLSVILQFVDLGSYHVVASTCKTWFKGAYYTYKLKVFGTEYAIRWCDTFGYDPRNVFFDSADTNGVVKSYLLPSFKHIALYWSRRLGFSQEPIFTLYLKFATCVQQFETLSVNLPTPPMLLNECVLQCFKDNQIQYANMFTQVHVLASYQYQVFYPKHTNVVIQPLLYKHYVAFLTKFRTCKQAADYFRTAFHDIKVGKIAAFKEEANYRQKYLGCAIPKSKYWINHDFVKEMLPQQIVDELHEEYYASNQQYLGNV